MQTMRNIYIVAGKLAGKGLFGRFRHRQRNKNNVNLEEVT
jgi:hypothetical protein